jgi:PTH2 family peptidyl-tRNA hydrolase
MVEEIKMIIGVRKDLEMGKGKIAAQASHAAVNCAMWALKNNKKTYREWESQGQRKIVIRLQNLEELYKLKELCETSGLNTSIVSDAGYTQVDPGSITCIGIGPAPSDVIDKITSEFPLL